MAEISINAATVKIYGRVRNEKMKVRESGLQLQLQTTLCE